MVLSPLVPLLFIFAAQSYSGTHSRGDTGIPMRNGLFFCTSWPTVSSCIYTNNRTLFLCSRIYLLQQWGSENNFKSHSGLLSSKQWFFTFNFGSVVRLIGEYQRGIKSAGAVYYSEMSIIYGTPQNYWCTWPYHVFIALPDAEVRLSLSNNVSSSIKRKEISLKELKGV